MVRLAWCLSLSVAACSSTLEAPADVAAPADTASIDVATADDGPIEAGTDSTATAPCEVQACPFVGAVACDGIRRLTCAFDASGCLDWAPPETCDDGDACTTDGCAAGACTNVKLPGCPAPPPKCEAGAKTCIDAQTVGVCADPAKGITAESTCEKALTTCAIGQCVGVLSWTSGDTLEDSRLWFTIHAAGCALGPAGLCWVLDTTKLGAALVPAELAAWFCGGAVTEGDMLPIGDNTEADVFAAATALYGCGGTPTLAGAVEPGHPLGTDCQVRDTAGTVSVVPCATVPGWAP